MARQLYKESSLTLIAKTISQCLCRKSESLFLQAILRAFVISALIFFTIRIAESASVSPHCSALTLSDDTCTCSHESQRPVAAFYNIECGETAVKNTYLSPLTYRGLHLALSGYWSKALPISPQKAIMEFDASMSAERLINPAHTAAMLGAGFDFKWGLARRFSPTADLQLSVGGQTGIDADIYYLSRNSNNPVAVNCKFQIGVLVGASYLTHIGRLPVLLTEHFTMPLTGCFFMPGYTETYYEIYIGNHKNIIHYGHPGNMTDISNLVAATLDLGKTGLQIGYRYEYNHLKANHLIHNSSGHSIVIGVIPNF